MRRRDVSIEIALVIGVLLTASAAARAQQIVLAPPAHADAAVVVRADVPELVTDRPDFTESSEVLAKGWFQLESGMSYEGDKAAGVASRSISAPGALMRIGLGHGAELRIGAEGLLSELTEGSRTSGASDFELGAKIRLFNANRIGFDLAVLPMVSLPTGADAFSTGGVDQTLKVTLARDLPAGFGFSSNVNLRSITESGARFHQEAASISIGHEFFSDWGYYVEAYGLSKMARGEGAGITFNAGVSHSVGGNLQFDVEAGRGLTAAAPDWFIGSGFAIRGPFGR